jgi:CheY-like chemotaxis protein
LGLAISRRLSELMGGEMWVESEAGVGSIFHFTILAQAAPAQYRMQRPVPSALVGKRVLLIDDHPVSLEILTRQLTNWKMEPVAVESGKEALEMLSDGVKFDLVILDRHMPEMDGMMLAQKLHDHPQGGEQLPLVMLSSLGTSVAEAKKHHLSALLSKPVKQGHLHKVLMATLAPQAPVQPAVPVRPTAPILERPPLRILLAEDNLVNQKVATHMLKRLGYSADIANNGMEVLQCLQRITYDVILMDVQMPEMDGIETTRVICKQWPSEQRPYIIAMTAHALSGDADKCLAAGMNDYISKPVHIEKLEAALEKSRAITRVAAID